ncbi:MAG: CBS domain-containing protein [Chloroflexi bacterium]|nr:CBS domain-containing protein [Chloroflexota bacterium]
MNIITSHERTDMDALAALYAASLLYPDYIALLPQKLNQNAKNFVSLYQDVLPFIDRGDLPREHIDNLLIVDALAIAQVRGMDENTQVHIIDHHQPPEPLPSTVSAKIEAVGATTTIMALELERRDIQLTRIGATCMLMGIYEDTGSLSYPTTSPSDGKAVAWLLEQGADLELAGEFLNQPLNADQRAALAELLSAAHTHRVKGRDICITAISLDHYVDELSGLVHQVMSMYEPDACFLLAEFEGNTQIIARSAGEAVNVAQVLASLGGGGHGKASAALVRNQPLAQVEAELLRLLEAHVVPPALVRDIMANNVHTLNMTLSAAEAAVLMRRYGHEGFPVVDDGRLMGILTRRDVDRALHHNRGDQPIRTLLHTGPVAVSPDDPVDEVRRVMLESNLGQVPVVKDGLFVGIVTRTDLIKLWALEQHTKRTRDVRLLLESVLPAELVALLLSVRDAAQAESASLYLVGGFVRDLLLGQSNMDLDLVVEGDAIAVANRVAVLRGGRVRSHARFGTAKIIFDTPPPGTPATLDLVTARTEFYERPSVLPQVEWSSIRQDLYRRDFTINTMAVCLDRERYGELLDYYGGERDLLSGQIRVLHNLSFIEDPTRILRAARFEQRLGFQLEVRTTELIDDAIDLLDHVTGERLRHELDLILAEAKPEKVFERLEQLGALQHLHPQLHFTRDMSAMFDRLRARVHERQAEEQTPVLEHCYLALLTSGMDKPTLIDLIARLHIGAEEAQLLVEVVQLRASLGDLTAHAMLPSAIYRLLAPHSREARFVLSVATESQVVRERLDLYETVLAQIEPSINGDFLRQLGLPPGPIYKEILGYLRDALLDGRIQNAEEQRLLVEQLARAAHQG